MFGTGESIRPPPQELACTLESQGVGLEVSNTVRNAHSREAVRTHANTMDEPNVQPPPRTLESQGHWSKGVLTWCAEISIKERIFYEALQLRTLQSPGLQQLEASDMVRGELHK